MFRLRSPTHVQHSRLTSDSQWYPDIPGKCINQVATWIANAASTIFTDLVILIMPIPPIWGLTLAKREKIGITAAFGLGSL